MRGRLPVAVTVLWLLARGLGAADTSDPCAAIEELDEGRAAHILKEGEDFKALGFGGGYGMVASFGNRTRVKEAEVVGTKVRVTKDEDVQFGPMLELHKFVWTLKEETVGRDPSDKKYRLVGATASCLQRAATLTNRAPIPLIGFGPFIGLRLGTEDVVESFGLGVMFGFRKTESDVSLNVGIAVMTDPNARTLGDGVEEGKPLPDGETVIRYKTGHQEGWSLLFSVGW